MGVLQDNLVLSTELIRWIGHLKEIPKLTFRALALRRSEARGWYPTPESKTSRRSQERAQTDLANRIAFQGRRGLRGIRLHKTSLREDSRFKPVWYRIRFIHCPHSVKWSTSGSLQQTETAHLCVFSSSITVRLLISLITKLWRPNWRKSRSLTVSLTGSWTSCQIGPRGWNSAVTVCPNGARYQQVSPKGLNWGLGSFCSWSMTLWPPVRSLRCGSA